MIESYDDTEERDLKEFAKRIEENIAAKPKTTCPYCIQAVIGGASGDRVHNGHWVRVSDSSTNLWTIDAACGETFKISVDSGD